MSFLHRLNWEFSWSGQPAPAPGGWQLRVQVLWPGGMMRNCRSAPWCCLCTAAHSCVFLILKRCRTIVWISDLWVETKPATFPLVWGGNDHHCRTTLLSWSNTELICNIAKKSTSKLLKSWICCHFCTVRSAQCIPGTVRCFTNATSPPPWARHLKSKGNKQLLLVYYYSWSKVFFVFWVVFFCIWSALASNVH